MRQRQKGGCDFGGMAVQVFLLVLIISIEKFHTSESHMYSWRQDYFRGMPIDHFSIAESNGSKTFDIRYLINDTWWDEDGGPIFFCPGAEGEIEDFAENMVQLF